MKSIFWTTNKVPKWVKFGKRILNGSVFGSEKDDNGWVSKSKISSYLSAKIPKYQPNPPPPPGNITFLDRYDSTRTALMFTEKGVFNRTAQFFQIYSLVFSRHDPKLLFYENSPILQETYFFKINARRCSMKTVGFLGDVYFW